MIKFNLRSLFRFSYQTHGNIKYADISLKNELFKLTPDEIESLRECCLSKSCSDPKIQNLHSQILTSASSFQSLIAIKSILYFYLQRNCYQKELWEVMGLRIDQILKKPFTIHNTSWLFQLAFVFGKLRRLNQVDENSVYKKISEQLLQRIAQYIEMETLQNLTHTVALITQYDIQTKEVRTIAQSILNMKFQKGISIKDVECLLWSLCTTTNPDLLKVGVFFVQNEAVINTIVNHFPNLNEQQQTKIIISLIYFRMNHKQCIETIEKNLKIFSPNSLITLIAKFIKTSMSQLNGLYPVLIALKEQFDEYFEQESKDLEITLSAIRFFIGTPNHLANEVRLKLAKNFKDYEKFIVSNIEFFKATDLGDIIKMADLFDSKDFILAKIQKRLYTIHLGLEDSIQFLYSATQYQELFKQQINDCLTHIINVHSEQIQELPADKHLKFMISLKLLEDKFPLTKVLLAYKDEKKILAKLHETVQKSKRDKLVQDQQFRNQFKFFNGFMANNFEFNLYLLQKAGVLNYQKEVRIGLYLVDYRIWNINLKKLNVENHKVQQYNQQIVEEFLSEKSSYYSDVSIDTSNDTTSLFVELDGINHFTFKNQLTFNSYVKNVLLSKYKLRLKNISLDENKEIKNSLKAIQDLLEKM